MRAPHTHVRSLRELLRHLNSLTHACSAEVQGSRAELYPLIVAREIAPDCTRGPQLGRYVEQLLAAAQASVSYYGGSLQYLVQHVPARYCHS